MLMLRVQLISPPPSFCLSLYICILSSISQFLSSITIPSLPVLHDTAHSNISKSLSHLACTSSHFISYPLLLIHSISYLCLTPFHLMSIHSLISYHVTHSVCSYLTPLIHQGTSSAPSNTNKTQNNHKSNKVIRYRSHSTTHEQNTPQYTPQPNTHHNPTQTAVQCIV